MKTIHNAADRAALITRIQALQETNPAQWGKMTIHQMMYHCILWEDLALNKSQFRQNLIGKIFGRMALRSLTKNDEPLKRSTPTDPSLKVSGNVVQTFPELKAKWITLLQEHEQHADTPIMHPFFGKMTGAQVGILAYKHTDHHLRQFGG
ncbi:DinB family protein [Chitinophaga sp. CB10]|uniref:DinB family protein n=1 Tax=Chitinophaga sp. CB10 TaxID=1891659 RepID=UPI000AC7DFAC|nr:DinB family protein [Chitinophaga sp. CB10]